MLIAVERRKTTLPRYRYFCRGREENSSTKETEKRRAAEDEITSTIFGPLLFLPDADAAKAILSLLPVGFENAQNIFLSCVPDIKFWPRKNGGVEPDMIVTLRHQDHQDFILVLEMKWNAPESGDTQLRKQYEQYNPHCHLVIAENACVIVSQCSHPKRDILHPLTWANLRKALGLLQIFAESNQRRQLGQWAQQADVFLEKIGVRAFQGFNRVADDYAKEEAIEYPRGQIFWRPFCGFSHFLRTEVAPISGIGNPIFYS